MKSQPRSSEDAATALADWLRKRPGSICWIKGPPGSAKTATVDAVLADSAPAARRGAISLDVGSVDQCIQQLLEEQTPRLVSPATSAQLVRLLSGRTLDVLILDALDVVQQQNQEGSGQITDFRLRHLLAEAADGRWPETAIIVTSRLAPPYDIVAEALTTIELPQQTLMKKPEFGRPSGLPTALEVIASSRQAISGWLLGFVTGHGTATPSLAAPAAVSNALEASVKAGFVRNIASNAGECFQMPDLIRDCVLAPGSERATAVHALMAEKLSSDDIRRYVADSSDLEVYRNLREREIFHRLALGDTPNAVLCYWQSLGNFSRLAAERAFHRGARICRTLNGWRPPNDISDELRSDAGAMAVVNDWGQYAICMGDARTGLAAAESAYAIKSGSGQPWEKATLAHHVASAMLLAGRVFEARSWVERAQHHTTLGLRMNEGIPTLEIMEAGDEAYIVSIEVMTRSLEPRRAALTLAELAELHGRARKVLAEYDRLSAVRVGGPTGPADPENLLDGHAAAMLALLDNRPDDARRIITANLAGWTEQDLDSHRGRALRTLLLRAQGEWDNTARALLAHLVRLAEERDDGAARCQLASIAAQLAVDDGDPNAALTILDNHLGIAATGGLGLYWIDLLTLRSKALLALGRNDAARESAAMALFGPDRAPALRDRWPACADLNGASHSECTDRAGALAAIAALEAAGAEIPEAISKAAAPPVEYIKTSRNAAPRLMAEPKVGEAARRMQLHEAAVAAMRDYDERGVPFALYFRKFDFDVLHGPMEFGPRLAENVVYEAIPPQANFLTIQSRGGSLDYAGMGTRFDRNGPALLLEEHEWQQAVLDLVPHADLIVSECLMLTEGVRFELETAYRANRWDRTVLLLPPLRSPFDPIDSDPIIQMFPRCVWADELFTTSLPESYAVKDLIDRLGTLGALPEQVRRSFANPEVRDKAHPIDLLPLANRYKTDTEWNSRREDEDDRIRYYGFWRLFRAAAIWAIQIQRGDDSFRNRSSMAEAYVQMAAIMLDHERDGDQVVLIGDLTFAEQCAQSAYNLIRAGDPHALAFYLRERAEKQINNTMSIRRAIKQNPSRFILRPRYGPFIVST